MNFRIGEIIYATISTKEKIETYQQLIRDKEWAEIERFIPVGSKFLDVGCGSGYAMIQAKERINCEVCGIDPDPGSHGVGRFEKNRVSEILNISQGFSEQLPFKNGEFNVVYSSHVLEHVQNERKSLQEMSRVMKNNGVLIIGMPTAQMAILNWFSQFIFTTHIKIYENFRFFHQSGRVKRFIKVFQINSHSYPKARSIWHDFKFYKVSHWKRTIEAEFIIESIHLPLWYSYPDYPRLFKPKKRKLFSSSVFFICKKK